MPHSLRTQTVNAVVFLLIVLFLYTAVSKWLDHVRFSSTLAFAPLIGPYSQWMGKLIIAVELVVALLLCTVRLRHLALQLSLFLMTSFTTYLVAMKLFAYDLPCSCGGVLEGMSWTTHIVFNAAIIGCIVFTLYLLNTRPTSAAGNAIKST